MDRFTSVVNIKKDQRELRNGIIYMFKKIFMNIMLFK